jgi:Uma2 family endonuclease
MTTNLVIGDRSLKLWTVQDYHQMSELGLLDPAERTELIDGQIVLMVAKGNPHILTVRLLTRALEAALSDCPVLVSIQEPVHLSDRSEPEPDWSLFQSPLY